MAASPQPAQLALPKETGRLCPRARGALEEAPQRLGMVTHGALEKGLCGHFWGSFWTFLPQRVSKGSSHMVSRHAQPCISLDTGAQKWEDKLGPRISEGQTWFLGSGKGVNFDALRRSKGSRVAPISPLLAQPGLLVAPIQRTSWGRQGPGCFTGLVRKAFSGKKKSFSSPVTPHPHPRTSSAADNPVSHMQTF